MLKIFYDYLNILSTIPIRPKLGYIYPVRPDGEIVIIIDDYCESVDCFYVIVLTGSNRGQKKFIRLRDVVTSRGRNPTKSDIEYYRINEFNLLKN